MKTLCTATFIASTLFVLNIEPAAAASKQVERGRYLVEEVAKCQSCHTPQSETSSEDRSHWLKGATLEIQPFKETPGWHKAAPDLTPSGKLWGRWKEEGILKFLQTGLGPSGKPAGPPMPTYKLDKADAKAIIEYLKSLP
jgi:mono/diheme cytochrome c family protein